MRTRTLLFAHELPERVVAQALEEQFGAAWFHEHHRCSIDTDGAFVAIDIDPAYPSRLGAEALADLETALGFVPKTAIHVQASSYLPGSGALAEEVVEALSERFDGRAPSAA